MSDQQHKLNIFDVLKKLDTKQFNFDLLDESEKKALQPYLIMKWLSCTSNELQIQLINEFVNPYVFNLFQDKQLLCDLLSVVTSGRTKRYQWIKSNSTHAKPASIGVIKQYYQYNDCYANDALPLLSESDIIDMAEELGYQSADIKKIEKEWKVKQ